MHAWYDIVLSMVLKGSPIARTLISRRGVVALALAITAIAAPVAAASASPGPGTFTQITTPSKDVLYDYKVGQTNKLHVAGRTSLDVTSVDVDCITSVVNEPPNVSHLASAVQVTNGQFSTDGFFPANPPTPCRLRAIPDGTDVSAGDYFGAYDGPIIRASAFGITKDGSSMPYSYVALASDGDGTAVLTDAGSCGVQVLVTIQAPQMQGGPIMLTCAFTLNSENLTASGTPTASEIKVDGHSSYLPSGVHSFLINNLGLGVAQTALAVSRKLSPNGDVTVIESAPLVRCSSSDVYPPTGASCPSTLPTGVTFIRASTVFRDGHQVRVRDTFISTDHHAHALSLQYLNSIQNETGAGTATGRVGYVFPGHGSSFTAQSFGDQISGLGSKVGTFYIRSDLYASSDDPDADTEAETWSRAPSEIQYDGSQADTFGMAYTLGVPANGAASLGFALSERWSSSDLGPLVSAASQDMLPGVSITSPRGGSKAHGKTTVTGHLKAGANGLPVSVKVNGHKAKIHKTSLAAGTYKVTVHVSHKQHSIKSVAKDVAGNRATDSIKINT
jgi:hypothetical protein